MKRILLAAVLGASFSIASAQSLKPGLWESTHKTQFAGNSQMAQQMAEAQKQMANMPPEQRKMMEDMMKSRGVSMNVGSGGVTVKYCLTKEMAERREISAQQRGDCKNTHTPAGGGTMKVAFTCTNPPSSGEGEVTFSGPEAYSMKMVVNTTVQGRPEKVNMEGSGRWLGSDCGDIKPLATK
ncbi:MAG TPA: DUF3617 domain-containing protein [Ramlibacter sp.]|nr:DUF3617 domain-containing protein [Ramlibacter sp.]